MKRLGFVSVIGAGLLTLLAVGRADAQGYGYMRYSPSTPTLSPWLNLYNKNAGPIDNYHNYVRPQMQLRDTLQQQENQIGQQGSTIRSLGQQVTRMGETGNKMAPTGIGSRYMNLSHFYTPQSAFRSIQRR